MHFGKTLVLTYLGLALCGRAVCKLETVLAVCKSR